MKLYNRPYVFLLLVLASAPLLGMSAASTTSATSTTPSPAATSSASSSSSAAAAAAFGSAADAADSFSTPGAARGKSDPAERGRFALPTGLHRVTKQIEETIIFDGSFSKKLEADISSGFHKGIESIVAASVQQGFSYIFQCAIAPYFVDHFVITDKDEIQSGVAMEGVEKLLGSLKIVETIAARWRESEKELRNDLNFIKDDEEKKPVREQYIEACAQRKKAEDQAHQLRLKISQLSIQDSQIQMRLQEEREKKANERIAIKVPESSAAKAA